MISTNQRSRTDIHHSFPTHDRGHRGKPICQGLERRKGAFASIRDDLKHLYSLIYYPHANPNHGWRAIKVKRWCLND